MIQVLPKEIRNLFTYTLSLSLSERDMQMSVRKTVVPGPGIKVLTFCLPGRRSSHFTIAALPTSCANSDIYKKKEKRLEISLRGDLFNV